jgi:exonuclease III
MRGWEQKEWRRQLIDFINKDMIDFVGLQETFKEEFSYSELRQLEGKHDFVWNWLAAKGHSGGILLGVKQDSVEVGAFDEGSHFLSSLLRNKKDGFKCEVVVVYDSTQHDKSNEFLEELANKCNKTSVPMVMRGDFNLIRGRSDKNN